MHQPSGLISEIAEKDTMQKNTKNKDNLKNGLAFASRVGDFVENSIGKTIEDSRIEAPVYDGMPEYRRWYRVPVPEGISGDGSSYHIYMKKAASEHLCIFLSGGGVAWNEYTAARPVTGGKVAAGMPNYYWNNLRPFTQIMNIHIGITEASNPMNPFNDWNFIVITYATGDFHVGNTEFEYESEDGKKEIVHFHGYTNFHSAMKKAREFFPDPDKMLIAGDSAGAFAVPALAGEIADDYYPDCSDITLFSDSGQLEYKHWKRTVRDVWKTDPKIWKPLHSTNITLDWYENLYKTHGQRFKYLYATSTHDYLLSAYYNDITYKKYASDKAVREAFYSDMKEMISGLKNITPEFGLFINNWRNKQVIKTGLVGGTVHTAVRQLNFHNKLPFGITMAQWLSDAVNGNIYDVGTELLTKSRLSLEDIIEKKL